MEKFLIADYIEIKYQCNGEWNVYKCTPTSLFNVNKGKSTFYLPNPLCIDPDSKCIITVMKKSGTILFEFPYPPAPIADDEIQLCTITPKIIQVKGKHVLSELCCIKHWVNAQ